VKDLRAGWAVCLDSNPNFCGSSLVCYIVLFVDLVLSFKDLAPDSDAQSVDVADDSEAKKSRIK
jgi:hypothetical protein